jgi:hypothetical protein
MVEPRKIFFNHIPKTAGTTVSAYLDNFYNLNEIWPRNLKNHVLKAMGLLDVEETERLPFVDQRVMRMLGRALEKSGDCATPHLFFDELVKELKLIHIHWNIRDVLPDGWHIITFLRDPQARLLSLYNDWRSISDEAINRIPRPDAWRTFRRSIRELSLTDVLRIDHEAIHNHYWNGMARALAGHVPTGETWKDPLLMTDDELLKTACSNLDTMFFVGIVEHFQEAMTLFQSRMFWSYNPAPFALNVRPNYQDDFSFNREDRRLIEQAIGIDREVYAHGKRLFGQAYDTLLQEAKTCSDLGDKQRLPGEWVENRYRRHASRFIAEHYTAVCDALSVTMAGPFFGSGWTPGEFLTDHRHVRYTAVTCFATVDHMMTSHPSDRYTVTLHTLSRFRFGLYKQLPVRNIGKIWSGFISVIYRMITTALPVWSVLSRLQLTMNGSLGRMISVDRGKDNAIVRFSCAHVPMEENGFVRLSLAVPTLLFMNRLLPNRYVSVGVCRIEID